MKNKILATLILSAVVSTGVYANCMQNNQGNFSKKGMMKKNRVHKTPILGMFKKLNLSQEQKSSLNKLIVESRKNRKSLSEAFTKESFDKAKYIEIMNEKRDNMIKSKAEFIEKAYGILNTKQKEQLKVLMEVKENKISKRLENLNK